MKVLSGQQEVQHTLKTAVPRAGKLHFVKFETQRINDCIDFIEAKGLHRTHNGAGEPEGKVRVVATGGGAYKFAEMFQVGIKLSILQSAALTTSAKVVSGIHGVHMLKGDMGPADFCYEAARYTKACLARSVGP